MKEFKRTINSLLEDKWSRNCLYIMIILHVLAAIFSTGFLQYDEHFEILEFLGFKLGITPKDDLSFEYGLKMRPWTQPFIYYRISNILSTLGIENRSFWTFSFRFLSSLLGISSVLLVLFYGLKEELGKRKNYLIFLTLLLWFFPLIHARLSAEAVAGSLFTIGFVLSFWSDDKRGPSSLLGIFIGLIFGLAFCLRNHVGIMILFFGLWSIFIGRWSFKSIFCIAFGILFAIGLNTLVDRWGYGEWVFPPIEYVKFNLVDKGASKWGESPWYYYITSFFKKGIAPISIPIIISVFVFWFRKIKSPITWITIPFVLIHSLIPHKELRFLIPMVSFLPLMLTYSLPEKFIEWKKRRLIIYPWIFINLILTLQTIRPLQGSIKFYEETRILEKPFKKVYVLGDLAPYRVAALNMNFYNYHYPEQILVKDEGREKLLRDALELEDLWVFSSRGKFYFETKKMKSCKNIYIGYPDWVMGFNIGNWVGRSEVWSLFYCRKIND